MQQTNRPVQNNRICQTTVSLISMGNMHSTTITGTMPASSGRYSSRRYQRPPSKHRIKLSRYSASGSTHSRGMGAMSSVRWLVMDISSTVGRAANATQRRRACRSSVTGATAAAAGAAAGAGAPACFQAPRTASAMQHNTNTP